MTFSVGLFCYRELFCSSRKQIFASYAKIYVIFEKHRKCCAHCAVSFCYFYLCLCTTIAYQFLHRTERLVVFKVCRVKPSYANSTCNETLEFLLHACNTQCMFQCACSENSTKHSLQHCTVYNFTAYTILAFTHYSHYFSDILFD